jgi:hypothetical protein
MKIEMTPIGRVEGGRARPEDDHWGGARSRIVLQEFLPREAVRQPAWSHELMRRYWSPSD